MSELVEPIADGWVKIIYMDERQEILHAAEIEGIEVSDSFIAVIDKTKARRLIPWQRIKEVLLIPNSDEYVKAYREYTQETTGLTPEEAARMEMKAQAGAMVDELKRQLPPGFMILGEDD